MQKILNLWGVLLLIIACASEQEYQDLGKGVSGPAVVELSESGEVFYAINTDPDSTYGSGSLLTVDTQGVKLDAVSIPRLGKSLKVFGNRAMLTTHVQEDGNADVLLFDLTDEKKPKIIFSTKIKCDPVGTDVREGYAYFPVSCRDGSLWIGALNPDQSAIDFKKVRNYYFAYQAIYLDVDHEMIWLFPTHDIRNSRGVEDIYFDQILTDAVGYDETGKQTTGPNSIADRFEENPALRGDPTSSLPFQIAGYSIGDHKATLEFKDLKLDPEPKQELHSVFIKYKDVDGKIDEFSSKATADQKVFRTRFVSTQKAAGDGFYLAQMGSNSLGIKNFSILQTEILEQAEEDTLAVGDFHFKFSKVYGFEGELPQSPFIQHFQATMVDGKSILLVNHFRRFSGTDSQARFSLGYKELTPTSSPFTDIESTDAKRSFIHGVVNNNGVGLVGSYYGNSLILFELQPGSAISIKQNIE